MQGAGRHSPRSRAPAGVGGGRRAGGARAALAEKERAAGESYLGAERRSARSGQQWGADRAAAGYPRPVRRYLKRPAALPTGNLRAPGRGGRPIPRPEAELHPARDAARTQMPPRIPAPRICCHQLGCNSAPPGLGFAGPPLPTGTFSKSGFWEVSTPHTGDLPL
jgi:hypothetical protein